MLDDNDINLLSILQEHGAMCKSDAANYGMAATTFQNHAKKLERRGLIRSYKVKQAGRGASKVMYELM